MEIAAIVVNYRTAGLTERCVESLLAELPSVGTFRVVVVDNDSGDGSADALRRAAQQQGWGDRVLLIETHRNGGLAYGINRALRVLTAEPTPPEFYWVVNSDALAEPGSALALVSELRRDASVGVVGSRVLSMDGDVIGGAFRALSLPAELSRFGSVWPLTKLLDGYQPHPDRMAATGDVDWVPGCSMVVRREVFEDIGWFDEGFFLYFEETDLCARAKRAGWRIRYSAEGTVRHEGSASTGMADTSRAMPNYWFESRRRYYRKHHGLPYAAATELASLASAGISAVRSRIGRGGPPRRRRLFRDSARQVIQACVRWQALVPDDAVVEGQSAESEASEDFPRLVAEDFATHDHDLTEPGFWALLAHRIGSHATRTVSGQLLGARAVHRVMATAVDWVWGIRIAETTRVGRRVRIWHSGCIDLQARAIGDDVHLRHNTTLGPARGYAAPRHHLPLIGSRADLGAGACVLGAVVIGQDAHVGANSVVLKNVAPGAHVLGVPARPVPI